MGLFKVVPWVAAAIFFAVAVLAGAAYRTERENHLTYKAAVEQAGKDAQSAEIKKAEAQMQALTRIREKYEQQLSDARALANYRLRYPNNSACGVRGTGSGITMDDAAARKFVATDDAFISGCADDAKKLMAWQEYCVANNCPVKD